MRHALCGVVCAALSGCVGTVGATAGLSMRHGVVIGWELTAGAALGGMGGQTIAVDHWRVTSFGGLDFEYPTVFNPPYHLARFQLGAAHGGDDGLLIDVGATRGRVIAATEGATAFWDVTAWIRFEGDDVQLVIAPRAGVYRVPH